MEQRQLRCIKIFYFFIPKKNDNVLIIIFIFIEIIDDLIATGGTAEAAAKLVEISKGKVAAFIFVINLFDLMTN